MRVLAMSCFIIPLAISCGGGGGGGTYDHDRYDHDDYEDEVYDAEDNDIDRGDFISSWQGTSAYPEYVEWIKPSTDTWAPTLNEVLMLPQDLYMEFRDCGDPENPNAWWDGSQKVTVCVELSVFIHKYSHAMYADFGNTEELANQMAGDTTYSAWHFVILHELGHGLSDYYDWPKIKNEDQADAFAAWVLIQMEAADMVVYSALSWQTFDWIREARGQAVNYADEHSTDEQRMYNLLCWTLGSDPEEYSYLLEWWPALEDRDKGGRCELEYEDLNDAMDSLLRDWAF